MAELPLAVKNQISHRARAVQYMPDFKYWHPEQAKRYLKSPKYPEAAHAAITEMHRQVGDLTFDKRGLVRRGLLVRHLVMPMAR
jgi:putative pyruvate formate lyase activating enzyme